MIDENGLKGYQSSSQDSIKQVQDDAFTTESEASLARHKQEIADKVATAVTEIEQLRQRQLELVREKRSLEELRHRQEKYEADKKELLEKLARALVLLEKEEEQTIQLREIVAQTRGRFRDMLGDLRQIDESSWQPSSFRSEIMKAAAMVESCRAEYRRALARIEAMTSQRSALSKEIEQSGMIVSDNQTHSLFYWFRAGAGLGIGFLLVGIAGSVLWLLIRYLLQKAGW